MESSPRARRALSRTTTHGRARARAPWRMAALAISFVQAASVWPAQAQSASQGERFSSPLPPNFQLGWASPDGHMREFVVPPETVETWSRLITLQVYQGEQYQGLAKGGPEAFAESMAARWKAGCANAEAGRMRDGVENGFPVALWSFECPSAPSTQKPETMFLKVIAGADGLYLAQYAFRRPREPAMVAPAMAFLRTVSACDTRRDDRPCAPERK